MEQNVFTRPEIDQRLQRFTRVRLSPTLAPGRGVQGDGGQAVRDLVAAVLRDRHPRGETLATFDGLTHDPQEFAAFLDRLAP